MAKKKKLTHDQKIIRALEKIKTPIVDKLRNLSIYFKVQSRSNESGLEHIAKNYHSLDLSDIELLEECIKNLIEHVKDKNIQILIATTTIENTIKTTLLR